MPSKLQLLPPDIVERLKELPERLASQERLLALWLFGSLARNEATPISDVDLAYLPDASMEGRAREQFETELYCSIADTLHTDEFTFVNLRQTPAFFAWRIITEGKLVLCHDAMAVATVTESIYRLAADHHWLRHVGNEEFLKGIGMPNSPVDKDRGTEFLRLISEDLQALQGKAHVSRDTYVNSRDLQAIVERRLHTATEGCINIGNHLVARLALRAPQDYADVFRVLADADILPREFVQQMMEMATLRDLLVHVYWAVDHERVYASLPARLATLESFVRHLARWLQERH